MQQQLCFNIYFCASRSEVHLSIRKTFQYLEIWNTGGKSSEVKHLSSLKRKKSTEISWVVVSESEASVSFFKLKCRWKGHLRRCKSCNVKKSWLNSRTKHVKFCSKIGGPTSKLKPNLCSDSALVPWGKGETEPRRRVKRNWNLLLTNNGSLNLRVTLYLLHNGLATSFFLRA